MPDVITRSTYLEIASTPLATPAWRVLDLSLLYGMAKRGADLPMPPAEGARPYERTVSWRVIGLPLLVDGARDREGAAHSDLYSGLDENIDALVTAIVEPPGTTAGTRAAVWHRATGNVQTNVHVEGLEPTNWGRGWVRFSLEISIPSGRWTAVP